MKLRYQYNAFGPKVHCIDAEETDEPALVGMGDTLDEARGHFFEQWLNRVALQDIKRGAPATESWDKIMRQLVGLQ